MEQITAADQLEQIEKLTKTVEGMKPENIISPEFKYMLMVAMFIVVIILIIKLIDNINRQILMREMKKYYIRENKKAAQQEIMRKQRSEKEL